MPVGVAALCLTFSRVPPHLTFRYAAYEANEVEIAAEREAMTPRDSSRAVVGLCEDMCPADERTDREEQFDLSTFEMLAGTERLRQPRVDHALATKKCVVCCSPRKTLLNTTATFRRYRRSAAGNVVDAKDVRTPRALLATMEHLTSDLVLGREDVPLYERVRLAVSYAFSVVVVVVCIRSLPAVAQVGFLQDRTRSVVQDFVLQEWWDERAIICLERTARLLIMCDHRLCGCVDVVVAVVVVVVRRVSNVIVAVCVL